MTSDPTPATDDGPRRTRTRARPSIEERAARRAYLETHGKDRYDSLLRHLRAGREMAIEPRGRWRVEWHPIARRLVLVALAVAAVYAVATFTAAQLREARVDAWAGPDAVQSGQRLASCPAVFAYGDPVFPNWIRFEGSIFVPAAAQLPIGRSNIGVYYHDSGNTLGLLRIYRVTISGLGEPGSRILVHSEGAPAGELYRRVEGCS